MTTATRPSFAKLDVLLVEPTPHMSTLIVSMLRHLKVHSVDEASTSSAALAQLAQRKYGAILVDEALRPMDGIALTRALRAAEGPNRDTAVVMMSSTPDTARILAARDAGISEFLRKPFAAQHVETRLVSILAAPREFITSGAYAGPDRRRRQVDYKGAERRGR
ncbi:response regulator [Devosia sp.]|uniref:response regulator n=1 Tax=Devosia sp. TaxID=1871048 RepID=UPI0035B15995